MDLGHKVNKSTTSHFEEARLVTGVVLLVLYEGANWTLMFTQSVGHCPFRLCLSRPEGSSEKNHGH